MLGFGRRRGECVSDSIGLADIRGEEFTLLLKHKIRIFGEAGSNLRSLSTFQLRGSDTDKI